MSLTTLINRPCQIVNRSPNTGDLDEYGGDVPGETTVDAVCELQQAAHLPGEFPDVEVSDTLWRLFLPAGTHAETGDAVIVDGEQFELVGDPWHARNPRTQTASHVEANVRRVAGDEGGS